MTSRENLQAVCHEPVENDEQERLSGLLKRCRARISPERASLGPYLRRPLRIGRTVTQEEVAEAVGISRIWYAKLEGDRPPNVSAAVLRRIADALMMDATEREAVFRLALPELRSVSLMDSSMDVLDAFGFLRGIMRRLWAATTEAEALTVVQDYGIMQVAAADASATGIRAGDGRWEHIETDPAMHDPIERMWAFLRERDGATALDDMYGYTFLVQPGDVVTRAEHEAGSPGFNAVLDSVGWGQISYAMGTVRSQRRFIARIGMLHYTRHEYSEIERALLSTLADLTSVALSG
jgi:transcriptional regulator with XRE-family HTH domain